MSMDNLSKIMQYIEPVHIGPLVVDGVTYDRPKKWLKVSPTLFDTDSCLSCGACCRCANQKLVLTSFEYDNALKCSTDEFKKLGLSSEDLIELRQHLHEESHTINGKNISVYVHDVKQQKLQFPNKPEPQDSCAHLVERDGKYLCKIYPARSLTCRMPHMKVFYTNHGCISIGISQYSRNWAVKCGVALTPPQSEEEFEQNKVTRLAKLNYLLQIANDLNCKTYLPYIISYVKNIPFIDYQKYLNVDILPYVNSNHKYKQLF